MRWVLTLKKGNAGTRLQGIPTWKGGEGLPLSIFSGVASFLLSEPKNDARGNSCIVYVSARFPNV